MLKPKHLLIKDTQPSVEEGILNNEKLETVTSSRIAEVTDIHKLKVEINVDCDEIINKEFTVPKQKSDKLKNQ